MPDIREMWVVSELYYPEESATGYYLTMIAEGLASSYPVSVLCGQPTYAKRGLQAPAKERHKGVSIFRCWSTTLDKDILPFRILNLITISVSVFLVAVRRFRRGDMAIVVTNPPTLPFMIHVACLLRGARSILLIHDVYPDALTAAGVLRPGSVLSKLVERLQRWLYRGVARIVVLGRDMHQLIQEKSTRIQDHIAIIPNWADLASVVPKKRETNELLSELGLVGKFVVQYSGNMGRTHDIEILVDAARQVADDPKIHFLLIGSGAKRRWVEREVNGLTNVTVLPPQPRERLCDSLNACDVSVISFVRGMAGISVPSRMYNALAAGRPIIAIADENSEIAMVVREEGAGWVVAPGNARSLVEVIKQASAEGRSLNMLGCRARTVVEKKYSYEHVIDAYVSLIENIENDHRGAGVRSQQVGSGDHPPC